MSKAKRQAAKMEEEQAMLEVGKVKLSITAEDSKNETKKRHD